MRVHAFKSFKSRMYLRSTHIDHTIICIFSKTEFKYRVLETVQSALTVVGFVH